jgi:hypothetical protein
MNFRPSDSVRAFLPVAVLAFCACGGGGGGGNTASQGESPATAPTAANGAPSISGDASGYARVGASYSFQPSYSDPDGDRLTFSANNLPPWANLDTANGRITGTPVSSDLGAYEEITITVADASHRAVTQPFTITVLPSTNGVATLRWEQPSAKFDGSPLDDLAGYRIVYGRDADDLDHSVFISDPSRTEFEFTTLDSGIWYFAVIAVNANGLEGPPTTAAMKSI